jgi:hypothetical protein
MKFDNLTAFAGRKREAVSAQNAVGGDGGDFASRRDDPSEIQRVRGGERYKVVRRPFAASRSQLLNGLRQGVLFARKSRDEAAAANLAPRFQAAEPVKHLAPRRQSVLAFEQPPEDNAVPPQQLPGIEFGGIGSARIVA